MGKLPVFRGNGEQVIPIYGSKCTKNMPMDDKAN